MLAQKLKAQIEIALTAWMYFTRIPLPKAIAAHSNFSQHSLDKSAVYFPVVGILVGAFAALVFLLAHQFLGSLAVAVILSMVAATLVTGAFHEDGLADFFDAFGGGWWSKERILEIMKDSRLGSFGALALFFALLVKYQSLVAISPNALPVVLVAGHAISRFLAASFIFTHSYVQANDTKSYFKPILKKKMTPLSFGAMAIIGCAPMLLLGPWYVLLIPALWLVRTGFGRWFIRKLGGYTGDCLGATQQITEISFYLGVLIIAGATAI